MVNAAELRDLITERPEWLLARETAGNFPLMSSEIEVVEEDGKAHFGFIDEAGFHSWRLNGFEIEGSELAVDVAGSFARNREVMRLIPRTAAVEITAELERARLEKANEVAGLIESNFYGVKLGRVALNVENGRIAQIEFETAEKVPIAAMADITASLTAESVFTAAISWADKISLRKKRPISDVWIICEKRRSRLAQKLHALLTERWRAKLTIIEVDRRTEPIKLTEMPKRKIRDLWREKPQKLIMPARFEPSRVSQRIIELAPDAIDIVFARNGETLRFRGLPFARIRTLMGVEKAWFGVGRALRSLTNENWDDLVDLVNELEMIRSFDSPNKRHEFYRSASEAWLESILRSNIKLLDANLILSPIYNQFRFSNDKIDLLAMRRDGRLVIIELKTQPDREMVFQSIDYWRKIELQRRRGILAAADLFEGREIADKPAVIYLAAPAWSFHRDVEYFARCVSPEIELWRFDIHQNWRADLRIVARSEPFGGGGDRRVG